MKIIQTLNFLKKQAQFRDFNLPPGVTDQMVDEQFGGKQPADYSKQSGEFETEINWQEVTSELMSSGIETRGLPRFGRGDIVAYYEYDAEVNGEEVSINDIRLLDIKTLMGDRYQSITVPNPDTKQRIFDGLKVEIAEQEKRVIREVSQEQPWEPDRTEELY